MDNSPITTIASPEAELLHDKEIARENVEHILNVLEAPRVDIQSMQAFGEISKLRDKYGDSFNDALNIPEEFNSERTQAYLEHLEYGERALHVVLEAMPSAVRSTVLEYYRQHPNEKLPNKMEIPVPGEPHALTVKVGLEGITSLKERNDGSYESSIESARTYLHDKYGIECATGEDVLDESRMIIRNMFCERITSADLGGVMNVRSSDRITGVVGHPNSETFDYSLSQLKMQVDVANNLLAEIFHHVPDSASEKNMIITVSKATQKASLNRLHDNVYTVDFPRTAGEPINPLFLVNNAAYGHGDNPSELMVVEYVQEVPAEIPENAELVVNKGKGTKYILTKQNPAPTEQVIVHKSDADYTLEERERLVTMSVDQFVPSLSLFYMLMEKKYGDKVDELRNAGRTDIELGTGAQIKIELDEMFKSGAWAKPDLSGSSKLNAEMEGNLGIPSQLISYELFGRLIPMARRCGALIDNFSGDAEDAITLEHDALKNIGDWEAEGVDRQFIKMNAAERSVMYSIGARAIFEDLQIQWDEDASIKGEEWVGVALDNVNSENIDEVRESIRDLYIKYLERESSDKPLDSITKRSALNVIRAYALKISHVSTEKALELKAIGCDEDNVTLNLTHVGNQTIQSFKSAKFHENEAALEQTTKDKDMDNEIVISTGTYDMFPKNSQLRDFFEPVLDPDGKTTSYKLPLHYEYNFAQQYFRSQN